MASEFLARDVQSLPESLQEENFWEIYQKWQNHAEGPLVELWKEHVDEHVIQVLFEFCDLLGLEWSDFCRLTVLKLKGILPEGGKFQQRSSVFCKAA